ncbi:MAG: hypothetical protein V6Z89_14390 [Desulfobacter sp.]
MDETTYYLNETMDELKVNFDMRDQSSCFIQLTFTKKDIGNLMNMETLGKYEMDVEGISGNCSRSRDPLEKQTISFCYKNGSRGIGTVFYNYKKLKIIMTDAFEQICKFDT